MAFPSAFPAHQKQNQMNWRSYCQKEAAPLFALIPRCVGPGWAGKTDTGQLSQLLCSELTPLVTKLGLGRACGRIPTHHPPRVCGQASPYQSELALGTVVWKAEGETLSTDKHSLY